MSVVRTPKRRDIQQLRGLAVLAVSLEHCGYLFARGGFIGVDIFFVISGYLILGKLNDEYQRTGTVRYGVFWTRRILRLAPAAAVTLAATALFVWLAKIDYFTFTRALKDAAWASASLLNIAYMIEGNSYWSDAVTSPLIHFWSLGVEEQFYLAASTGFLLLSVLSRRRPKPVRPIYILITVVTLVALYFEMQANTVAAFYNPIGRGWEFALGGLVAASRPRPGGRLTKVLASRAVKVISWGGLLAAIALITPDMVWPGPLTLVVAILTCGVLYRDRPHDQPRHYMAFTKPISTFTTWVGDVSYSLYLWHWPVLVLGGWALSRTMTDPREADPFRNFLLLEVAMLLAALSERFIERPIITRGTMPRASRLATVFFLVCYANGTLTFSQLYKLPPEFSASTDTKVTVRTGGTAAPVQTFTAAELEAAAIHAQNSGYKPDCAAHFQESAPGKGWDANCTVGDAKAKATVALLGDSHAHQWLPALDALGKKHNFKVVAYTKSSCPFVTVTVTHPRANRGFTECDAWNTVVTKRLRARGDISAIIVGRSLGYQTNSKVLAGWRLGTKTSLGRLQAITPHIVLLGDNPASPSQMTACVLTNLSRPDRCNIPVLSGVQPDERLLGAERAAVRQLGLSSDIFVSVRDFLCTAVVCQAITPKGNVMMRQGSHISVPTALEYQDSLWQRLEALLSLDSPPPTPATPKPKASQKPATPTASPTPSPTPSPTDTAAV